MLVALGTGCGGGAPTTEADAAPSAMSDAGPPTADCEVTGCDEGVCDETSGACVECIESSACAGSTPICRSHACEPCLSSAQCAERDAEAPRCRSDGRCAACLTDADCTTALPFCSDAGVCTECATDADCSDVAPACREGSCTSCAETSCDEATTLRELFALQCAASIHDEGDNTLADAWEAVACSAATELFPTYAAIEAGVEAGSIVVDDAAFAACRAAWEAGDDAGCDAVLVGTLADGSTCVSDSECASLRCELPDDGCAGVCTARSTSGQSCSSDSECVSGLACLSSICEVPPELGEACVTRCASPLYCTSAHVCASRLSEGTACSASECATGLTCRGGRCSSPPAAGETCWPAYLTRCAEGARCVGDVCTAEAPDGGPCSETVECEHGSRCVDGSCADVRGLGETCTDTATCAFGTECRDGRCRALPDVGAPCSTSCLRGTCTAGTCQSLPLYSSCDGPSVGFDVFDPCGSTSSCTTTLAGSICAPEGGVGASCGGTSDLGCREPDLYCGDDSVCVSYCGA